MLAPRDDVDAGLDRLNQLPLRPRQHVLPCRRPGSGELAEVEQLWLRGVAASPRQQRGDDPVETLYLREGVLRLLSRKIVARGAELVEVQSDAGQRGAQLVRGIGRKVSLELDERADLPGASFKHLRDVVDLG